jgi:chloramphenicol 3-O-phosphotransferase
MSLIQPACILITGIMAAGKSTIAQQVAEKLDRSVHLRGDSFRRMIVNGQASMEPPLTDEAFDQLMLRYRLAALAADQYCDAGFTVICQDIIIGPMLKDVVALYQNWPLYVVVLCPNADAVLQRDATRHKQTYTNWTPNELDHELRMNTLRLGLWLDTTHLTVAETVTAIFDQIGSARLP